jgi:hypothetical protein
MNQKSGIELIAEERTRQIAVEGWDAGHDNEADEGQLAKAAACYAMPEEVRRYGGNIHGALSFIASIWPWDGAWWKPTPEDRRRELAKAGALCAAEIDRLNRAEAAK